MSTQLINGSSLGFATFQSNNQRCVVNANGIFVAYLTSTNNGNYTNQTFVVQKSTDNGRTFSTIYTNSCLDQNPLLETDSQNNIYLIYVESYTNSILLKFTASDYTTPIVTTSIPISVTPSKHCTILDDSNNKLYYFMAEKGMLTILNKSGVITHANTQLLETGTNAFMEYPLCTIDQSGVLYFAWTTQQKVIHPPNYWSLHWMKSDDFGITWKKSDGTAYTLPVICDDSGPTEIINESADTGTGVWLCSFTFSNGRLHCIYWKDSVANKYIRIHPDTGVHEVETTMNTGTMPEISGVITRDLSGSASTPSKLYYTGAIENGKQIQTYISSDNGNNWSVYDNNDTILYEWVYSIGGYREQYNGKSYGVFTLINTKGKTNYTSNNGAYVYSFSV